MILNSVSNSILVAWYLGLSLLLTVVVAVLAIALQRLNQRLTELTTKLEPVLEKADQALSIANDKLAAVGDATENILSQGELIAATVESKTETTSRFIQRTIHAPFIGANALIAALAIGARTFGVLQSRRNRSN